MGVYGKRELVSRGRVMEEIRNRAVLIEGDEELGAVGVGSAGDGEALGA